MTTTPATDRAVPRDADGRVVLTSAGAFAATARDLRAIADRVAQGVAYPPQALAALLRRGAENLEACVAALDDPIAHRPCCRHAAQRRENGR